MSRFGFPSASGLFSGVSGATAYARVQSAGRSVGMGGATIRGGRAGAALGFSVRKSPAIKINPKNNPFSMRFKVRWNPLSFGSRSRGSSGVGAIGERITSISESRSKQIGANAVRQLIQHYGKVPNEIRKDVRKILRIGGLQLKRRAEWYWRASSRAQRAIKVSTSIGWKNAGTRVWVDNSIMPHNRAWERILGDRYFIHVPWGNYNAAGPLPNRPALRPALQDVGPRIITDVNRQLIKTVNRFQQGKV